MFPLVSLYSLPINCYLLIPGGQPVPQGADAWGLASCLCGGRLSYSVFVISNKAALTTLIAGPQCTGLDSPSLVSVSLLLSFLFCLPPSPQKYRFRQGGG